MSKRERIEYDTICDLTGEIIPNAQPAGPVNTSTKMGNVELHCSYIATTRDANGNEVPADLTYDAFLALLRSVKVAPPNPHTRGKGVNSIVGAAPATPADHPAEAPADSVAGG